ncbi:hypothetical protein HJC23_003476 [Cyclotella cryptica]|uniref:Peptidase S1 domain-containing protein n=1 Tax=Cyclotella cryptica TaxID=29204 RepID=A0ABD3QW02_9STRA|eukprot:CCRYP_002631-RB/>CCRYP_002631-RB protein AED:0.03 eAED:0.03 QI:266/1/1/1/1/1/4/2741/469
MKILDRLLVLSPFTFVSGGLIRRRQTEQRIFKERIIGGFRAPIGRFPYAVSLQSPDGALFCGGSLIAPDVVLSAAHCAGGSYDVVIGRYDLGSGEGDVVPMQREVTHPEYNPSNTDNDFNLIFLDRPTTAAVAIVKLNKESFVPSAQDPVTVMGWGDTAQSDFVQELSDILRSVQVTVVSNDECAASRGWVGWFNYQSYEGSITQNMLCARGSNADSCQGDSGGPLVVEGSDPSGADDLQVGVVSWGIGCANSEFPGVYSRISAAYEWIRSEVCSRSSDPPSYFQCYSVEGDSPVPVPLPSATAPLSAFTATTPPPSPRDGWADILEENFDGNFGQFNAGGVDVMYYPSVMKRNGVVRIQNNGEGSTLYSNKLTLDRSFSRFRVTFSFYSNSMEIFSDSFCLDVMADEAGWTEEKCWLSFFDFRNDQWYDETVEFTVGRADSLRIRFRCAATSEYDDVLFDTVKLEGYA